MELRLDVFTHDNESNRQARSFGLTLTVEHKDEDVHEHDLGAASGATWPCRPPGDGLALDTKTLQARLLQLMSVRVLSHRLLKP